MASEEDLIGAMRKAHEAGDTDGAQRIGDMINTQRAAAAPKDQGALSAGLDAAANTVSFGVVKPLAARISSAITGDTYAKTRERMDAQTDVTANAHPWATVAGDVAGIGMGAGVLGGAVKAAEAAPFIGKGAKVVSSALQTQKGQLGRNVLRLAAPGAVVAGTEAAASGESLPQGALDTAIGAAGGVVGGAAVGAAGKLMQSRAVRLLASHLDEAPDVLANAMAKFRGLTNRMPSMSDIVNMKSTGQLKHLAEGNPAFGSEVAEEVQRRATAPAQSLVNPAGQAPTVPTDVNSLETQRSANMTAAMTPIRGTVVPVDASHADLLSDPRVRAAVRATKDPQLRDAVTQATNEINDPAVGSSNALTVNHLDSIRQSLRNEQSNFANPQNSRHNSQAAQSMGALADQVGQVASSAEPKYAAALQQHTEDSNYIHGFKHGLAGKTQGEVSASSDVGRALNTAEGQTGYDHGAAEGKAASNLDTITPSYIKPQQGPGAASAAHLAVGVAKGGPWGAYHILKAIPGVKASDTTLQKAARMLVDPKQAPGAIAKLRALGVQNEDLGRVVSAASAMSGQEAGRLSGGQ
jgi:hypothetical protein